MKIITNAYINALLADAAYVDLLNEPLDSPTNRRNLADRLTPTQAAYLASNFEVASTANESDNPLAGSGFDAVVWRGRAGGEFAGQTYVSMRGTEPNVFSGQGADLRACADLASSCKNIGVRSCITTSELLASSHGKTFANRVTRRAVPRHFSWGQARGDFY